MAHPEADTHWRNAGERIQTLLDASSAGGIPSRERAEALVAEVVELYGAALERIVRAVGPAAVGALTDDDLVASLLLVHGLHPHDVTRRVSDALERVRPYLGSHGGDVELLDVTNDVVHLRFQGSCKSCPSSAVTLELAVEDAVRAAAPEVATIEVVAAEPEVTDTLISAESLMARVHSHGPTTWHPIPDVAGLTPGEVGGFAVAGVTVLACRVGDSMYAYLDLCPGCDDSLAGAQLHRRLGADRDPVLRCPRCGAHYDVVHAGASVDETAIGHLQPVPLLVRDGVWSLALQAEPTGLSA